MRARRERTEDRLYEATFYCSLLLHASSQREAVAQVKELARRNHLKIESGASDRLQVYLHRQSDKSKSIANDNDGDWDKEPL